MNNILSIIADGGLVSDAAMIARGGPTAAIGMSGIKERRVRLPVECHQGDYVGDYVPFYFCPRSIMLYVIHCANHPELSYRGGQGSIVHLEADLHTVVAWANSSNRRWAFSRSNAGAVYAQFWANLADLDQINWGAVAATDFRRADVKESKQAEFLVHESFPWNLVTRVGVHSLSVRSEVEAFLKSATHHPGVEVILDWYYLEGTPS